MNHSSQSDPRRLLEQARHDNQAALGQLLEQYRPYLTLLARVQIGRRLQGKADAGDLVQETFLEAYRHFPGFQGNSEGELLHWVRQILAARVAKLVRRYLRTQRRDVRLERQVADELGASSRALGEVVPAPQSTPSERAVRREQAVVLVEALEHLPADYREVLILRHLEERSFAEVAQQMQRSVEAVKKLWARALPRLREVLGESS
jgi:RNA polymerase sigma-70 factor (ECF subfamily)